MPDQVDDPPVYAELPPEARPDGEGYVGYVGGGADLGGGALGGGYGGYNVGGGGHDLMGGNVGPADLMGGNVAPADPVGGNVYEGYVAGGGDGDGGGAGAGYEGYVAGGAPPSAGDIQNAFPAGADAAPARDIHDPFGLGAGPLVTTPLVEHYRGEEYGTNEPGHLPTNMGGMDTPTTAYAVSPDIHRAGVQDGQLVRPGGAIADSSAATKMWAKDKDERMNFAMDGQGSMYLSDPKSEFIALRNERRAAGETTTSRINHSTMVAGGDVAGAGTARVRDGKVETLGDGSGHYQPAVTQTAQVAETLAAQGVLDPARSSIELTGKGDGQKELLMSTQELLSYGDDFDVAKQRFAASGNKADLAAPEATIRGRHAAKDSMQQELLGRVGGGGSGAALAQLRQERTARAAPHVYDVIDEAPEPHVYDVIDEGLG
jgi:hypothetical protein